MDFGKWGEPAVIVSAIAAVAAIFGAWNSWKTRKSNERAVGPRASCEINQTRTDGWYYVALHVTNPTDSRWGIVSVAALKPRGARLYDQSAEVALTGGIGKPKDLKDIDVARLNPVVEIKRSPLYAAGTTDTKLGMNIAADVAHLGVHLFIPSKRRTRLRSGVQVVLRIKSVSLDAMERRNTIDIHRTLSAHASEETPQNSSARS